MEEPVSENSLDAPTQATSTAPDTAVRDTAADDLDATTVQPGSPGMPQSVPVPGQTIDGYELIRELARGGMGVVYLAKQPNLNRLVALKMVLESDTASADELQRFANEAKAAASLDHPGIVPVYEVNSHAGRPYFSMAYVDGKSLAAVIQDGPLMPMRAAAIARDVASAIAHAHANRIIHRDLKPANILIDSEGAPRITDFGVSKSLASQSALTAQGELIGTPHYMPPEQAGAPESTTGPPSDVYSIGAVLYASLTGRPPFQASSPIDVVAQLMTQDPVPPCRLMSGIPEDLETITLKCLSKSPKDRYETAMALADDLSCYLKGEPISAKPPGLIKRITHSIRRHVFLASVSGSFAFLLVVLTVLAGVSLIRARARVTELTLLLEFERETARRFAYHVRQDGDHTVEHYELDRLTDAAVRLVATDRQLAAHLSRRAATLAQGHSLEPPAELLKLMREISEIDQTQQLGLGQLIPLVEAQIKRPLTDFEQAVYGLADESPKMAAPGGDGSGHDSAAEDAIDE